jgi:hypothetical protein
LPIFRDDVRQNRRLYGGVTASQGSQGDLYALLLELSVPESYPAEPARLALPSLRHAARRDALLNLAADYLATQALARRPALRGLLRHLDRQVGHVPPRAMESSLAVDMRQSAADHMASLV